jgi:surface antigen
MTFSWFPEASARPRKGALTASRLLSLSFFALSLSGCSISFPIPPLMHDGDITGSIKAGPQGLGTDLDADDWRVAKPMLADALKSEASQDAVRWTNPATGHRGAFQTVAGAFKREGDTCRAFVARVAADGREKMLQAIGCLKPDDTLFVEQVEPWKTL